MVAPSPKGGLSRLRAGVQSVLCGRDQRRLRATWRFGLAFGIFPVFEVVLARVMSLLGLSGLIPGGFVQALVFLPFLVAWAWAIDQRPVSDYGVSLSTSWLVDLLVAFVAVIGVWSVWFGLAAAVGWVRLELSLTAPQGHFLWQLAGTWASLALNTWVQDTVFFAIVLASAAEGIRSRGVEPTGAALGAWLLSALFFAVVHGVPGPLDFLSHVVGGAVFGLLYVHTGELALPLGVHWGSSWAAGMVFASPEQAAMFPSVFEVTTTWSGATGLLISNPLYVTTYLVLAGWLYWRRGSLSIDPDVTSWQQRGPGILG